MDTIQTILSFFGWWQFVTCLFAFAALLSIWFHLGRKKGDLGQVWLALSVLCWSFSGLVEIYFSRTTGLENVYHQGWRSIFSLLNSLFILLALPWFRYKPKWMEQIIDGKSWYWIVGLPFVFSLLPTVSRMVTGDSNTLITELDVYYAVLTLIILGFVLWESFTKRGLQLLAYLSVIFVLVTLVAQFYKVTDATHTLLLYSAIFKSLLIMIFFALALSWVKDLADMVRVDETRLGLQLEQSRGDSGRYEYFAMLSGLEKGKSHRVKLTSGNYQLLEKFAQAKINNPEGGWLEIKPKGETRSIDYPIKDYNEIKRLLHTILNGVYGKELWDKERHEAPLREALFEFSKQKGRRIQLRIAADQIIM